VISLRIQLPTHITKLCRVLDEAGFQCYVVGGALRDLLRGEKPDDWDITTDATPEEVEALFSHTIPTGREFGTITVVFEGRPVEITTMRQETGYSDHRHPDSVQFTKDIRLDLSRRDFTVNAIAYNPITEKFIDPFRGRFHLKRRLLASVGDAKARFREDPLRMLRLIRFQGTLGFRVDKKTAHSIQPGLMRLVSAERIGQELAKLLLGNYLFPAFELFYTSDLLQEIIPELAACKGVFQGGHHRFDVLGHSIMAAQHIPPELHLRWAAILHDVGKPVAARSTSGSSPFPGHAELGAELAEQILRRLRCSNQLIAKVTHLVRYHMYPMQPNMSDRAVRRMIAKIGQDHIFDVIALRQADITAMYFNPVQAVQFLNGIRQRVQEVIAEDAPLTVAQLAVDGTDLMRSLQIEPGPIVGWILQELLDMVMDDPGRNNREELLTAAQQLLELGQDQGSLPQTP
jgi:tRNA nucleotidyltransferase (CCA-adding enzyme)